VLFIAPYSPVGAEAPALGAAKKIRLFCKALEAEGFDVSFLNTANNCGGTSALFEQCSPVGVRQVLRALLLRPRFLGRFLFGVISPMIGVFLAITIRPKVVWIYNQGFGEILCGIFAATGEGFVVNEIEDLATARLRGNFELKPRLDAFFSRRLSWRVNRFVCVSSAVADQIACKSTVRKIGRGGLGRREYYRNQVRWE